MNEDLLALASIKKLKTGNNFNKKPVKIARNDK